MRFLPFALFTVLALTACSQQTSDKTNDATKPASVQEVNVYSARHYDTDLKMYTDFTDATGIKVNLIEAKADALIERISNEGDLSKADLLITVDAGRLWRAEQAGILAPVSSKTLEQRIPENLRHPEGQWFGLSSRARVIIYSKANERPSDLNTYEDLANPVHQGKVCIRSSGNMYNISLLASLIDHLGANDAETWAKNVVANFARKPQGNDTAQIEAVASGECQIAVVNSYYLARLRSDADPARKAIGDAVGIIFPNQNDRGTHINISGAGLVKSAPNKENAIKFLEYLTNEKAQSYFANGNNEYPVVAGVAPSSAVVGLGGFKEDKLNAATLGKNQAEAVRIFDRAGWQ